MPPLPLTGYALTSNITLAASDVGALALTGGTVSGATTFSAGITSSTITASGAVTAGSTVTGTTLAGTATSYTSGYGISYSSFYNNTSYGIAGIDPTGNIIRYDQNTFNYFMQYLNGYGSKPLFSGSVTSTTGTSISSYGPGQYLAVFKTGSTFYSGVIYWGGSGYTGYSNTTTWATNLTPCINSSGVVINTTSAGTAIYLVNVYELCVQQVVVG